MNLPPTFTPLRPRLHRKRRDTAALSPPPPSTVTVVSVGAVDGSSAIWMFSSPVTLGAANAPELQIDADGDGFIPPESVAQGGPSSLLAYYGSGVGVFNGDAWRIISAPPDITPAVAVPESGNVL